MEGETITRRGFIHRGAAAAGAAALLGLAPRSVLGANESIRVAVVGVGGRGSGLLGDLVKKSKEENLACAAVCDVYRRRLLRAQAAAPGAEGYGDYRRILDRNDIDAVVVATPDHWHARISIDALESGKHVYCEKPMTHTVEQALAVRNTVRRFGGKRLLQVGANATGDDAFWKARQAIEAGRIGKVTWAQGSYNRNARVCLFNDHQRPDPDAGPDQPGERAIDWDLWLGHQFGLAPKIPWTPDHFFRFRKYWPYSGGVATDLLFHKLSPLLIAIAGPEGEYPRRVNASGGLYIEKDGRDIPDTFLMTADYPSEWSIFLISTLTNDTQVTERIHGKHGTLDLEGDPRLRVNGPYEEEFKGRNEGKTEAVLKKDPGKDLLKNFLDAIRGKDRLLSNAELGAATMVAIKLAVDSYRQEKTMLWDAAGERAVASA